MQILVAEDDAVTRRLLEAHLGRWGFDVVEARDGSEAWQVLQSSEAPRLAIVDWMMPGMDGLELCRRMRRGSCDQYTYIILLTALTGEENLCAGMDAGADDYLTKPFNVNELQVRLRAGRRIIELQDQLITTREVLREKASRDPLTGLWNHEEIVGCLARELSRARRSGQPVSVVMADIDHFKGVNDCYGHLAGDVVLRAVAQKMQGRMRPYDCVGRYGGEEFLVVLAGCGAESAQALAERLRLSVCREPVDTPDGTVSTSLSLGVATCSDASCQPADLIRSADQALYRAKRNGRNRVEANFGPESSASVISPCRPASW